MLVLTRRVGETLIINDDINVTVLGVKRNQVRFGIEAPKDVSIHREEIHERLKSEDKTYTDEHQKKLNGEGNE